MPTLAIFMGEPLDKLVARLFPATTRGGAQASRQAADALLKANPQLSDITHLSSGTVIVVPDLPQQTANSAEILQPAILAPTNVVHVLGDQATAFGTALAAQAASTAAQANATITLLKDPSLAAAASKNQILAGRLTAVTNSTSAALKDMQTQQAVILQGLAQLQQDLAKFTAPTLPGTPPAQPMTPPPVTPPPQPQPGPIVTSPEPAPTPAATSLAREKPTPQRAPRAAKKKKK
jgi:phage tail protein X